MKVSLSNAIVLNIAAYAFFAFRPTIIHLFADIRFFHLFFVISTLFLFLSKLKQPDFLTSKHKITLSLFLFVYVIYITTPLVAPHSLRISSLLWFIPLILIILLADNFILAKSFNLFKKIIVFLTSLGLIVLFLNLIGLSLPYIEISRGSNQIFRVYGPSVALYTPGGLPVHSLFGGLQRFNGPFDEPGHFAIILSLILFVGGLNIKRKQDILLVFAGILTFSPFFYFALLLIFLLKIIRGEVQTKTQDILLFFRATLFLVTVILVIPYNVRQDIRYMAYDRTFEEVEHNIIRDRVQASFLIEYGRFLKADNILTGLGHHSIENIDTPSNYRTFIYSFGLLGVVLSSIPILLLAFKMPKTTGLFLFVLLTGALLHRYWFLLAPGVFIVSLLGVGVHGLSRKSCDAYK